MRGMLTRRKSRRSGGSGPIHMYIDLPPERGTCSGRIAVEGWALSTAGAVQRVEALLGGVPLGELEYGFERPDVEAAFAQVPGIDTAYNAGYRGSIDLTGIPPGAHDLIVRVVDAGGHCCEARQPITVGSERTIQGPAPVGTTPPPAANESGVLARMGQEWIERASLAIQPAWPDGHFYSPIVNVEDVWERRERIWPREPEVLGIDFNQDGQRAFLVNEFGRYMPEYDYPEERPAGAGDDQFYSDNQSFGQLDSRALFVMLRSLRPKRMIEVGSGFSSLLTADVNRRFLGGQLEFTCIEPYPNPFLLKGIRGISRIIQQRVEDVPLSEFERLKEGDILFIDSSHVAKTGSDVNYEVFEILPRLAPGVVIHFHDVPLPFEYPREWVLEEGRSWNELYVVRALLMYCDALEILFGSSYAIYRFADIVERLMGRHVLGGGSIWLRKVGPGSRNVGSTAGR